MSKSNVKSNQTTAVVLRCVLVTDSGYDSETLVPCQASAPRVINSDERAEMLTYMGWKHSSTQEYVLIEPLGEDEITALIQKAKKMAADELIAAQKRQAAEERRRKAAEIARKKKRLEKLEALAKGL